MAENMNDLAAGLLEGFGLTSTSQLDDATAAVGEVLEQLQIDASVATLVHGTLILECDPAVSALLAMERDRILQQLQTQLPGLVDRLRIRPT